MTAFSLLEIFIQPQTIAVVLLCLVLLAVIRQYLTRPSGLPLPPGPPIDNFFLGNSIPTSLYGLYLRLWCWYLNSITSAYRKFEEWTKEYGPVFSLKQGFQTIIVIGRLQAAIDIMEKEGASLVDRPLHIAAGETLSGGMRVLLTPAGDRFKKMRRWAPVFGLFSSPKVHKKNNATIERYMRIYNRNRFRATPLHLCGTLDSIFLI